MDLLYRDLDSLRNHHSHHRHLLNLPKSCRTRDDTSACDVADGLDRLAATALGKALAPLERLEGLRLAP